MRKYIYIASFCLGIYTLVDYYILNFKNLSETQLIDAVFNWYLPLVFGLYGFSAYRIYSRLKSNDSALDYIHSKKDRILNILVTIIKIICFGVIGKMLFVTPFSILKKKTKYIDISIAFIATLFWLLVLWIFFKLIWPSL